MISEQNNAFENGDYYTPLQEEIVKTLRSGPMTRAELVTHLNAPRTTIYDNLMGLMMHNIVSKFCRPTNTCGRPLVFFRLNPSQ